MNQSELLTTAQAAEYLKVSNSFLSQARMDGRGPKYVKVGNRVRYKVQDLEQWIDEHSFTSSYEY